MNISGIVVKAAPERATEVLEALRATGSCEIHFQDQGGKIIVTVEAADTDEGVRKMRDIMNLPGVLCANLAYTCSDELAARGMSEENAVPEALRTPLPERR